MLKKRNNCSNALQDFKNLAGYFYALTNSNPTVYDKYSKTELENVKIATEGLHRFIEKAKAVTQLTELTPELAHEFIQKIVVGKPEYKDGKRYQSVEIHYNGVGMIREPSPEEMEVHFQEHLKTRGQRKTA